MLLGIANLVDRFGPAATIALAAAILWQLTPAKQWCLNRHHARPPLAAFGRASDLDAVRFGASSACWCFGSCWGLMLLPLVIMSSPLAVMAAISIWIWAEGLNQPRRPTWRVSLPTAAARIASATLRPDYAAVSVGLTVVPDP
jgi:predicted metal-binding membrane protein